MKKSLIALAAALFFTQGALAATTYFKCTVTETATVKKKKVKVPVSIYFAVNNLDSVKATGTLATYPGANEDTGALLVSPNSYPGTQSNTIMSNLNAQGGDLSIKEDGTLKLFGDGDGYQFTDLVLWADGDEEAEYTQGYVRDYGPAYSDPADNFKQFITCQKSNQPL